MTKNKQYYNNLIKSNHENVLTLFNYAVEGRFALSVFLIIKFAFF